MAKDEETITVKDMKGKEAIEAIKEDSEEKMFGGVSWKSYFGVKFLMGMFVSVSAYSFMKLEQPEEILRIEAYEEELEGLLATLDGLNLGSAELAAIEDLTAFYIANGPGTAIDDLNWDWDGCVYFIFTIITTIGYGTFAPVTAAGRALTVVYGIVGLIIMGIWITQTALLVEDVFTFIEKKGPCPCFKGPKGKTLMVLISYVSLWTLCAWFAMYWLDDLDNNFGSAMYFIFITWSTIGLGDYASEGAFFYFIGVLGLVLFAALMSALNELWKEYMTTFTTLAKKLADKTGVSKGLDSISKMPRRAQTRVRTSSRSNSQRNSRSKASKDISRSKDSEDETSPRKLVVAVDQVDTNPKIKKVITGSKSNKVTPMDVSSL